MSDMLWREFTIRTPFSGPLTEEFACSIRAIHVVPTGPGQGQLAPLGRLVVEVAGKEHVSFPVALGGGQVALLLLTPGEAVKVYRTEEPDVPLTVVFGGLTLPMHKSNFKK